MHEQEYMNQLQVYLPSVLTDGLVNNHLLGL